ncbi:MAG TPA: response regulator transcription factor [Acidimicrobiales bacterium]|nr:response regulator transcription factor [Acidimicrobiales bacterium]
MTTVLLVDDHTVLREGLRRSLEASGIRVAGESGEGRQAVEAAAATQPDVVLMDVALPDQDGIDTTRQVLERCPDTQVVMLTMFADGATLQAAIRAGAVGYLVKDCTTAEIVGLVEAVAARETAMSAQVAESLLRVESRLGEPLLSPREVEVLQALATGASTSEVAARLFISVKTVKNHLANIYEKMDARDRTQAVLQALRLGVIRLR